MRCSLINLQTQCFSRHKYFIGRNCHEETVTSNISMDQSCSSGHTARFMGEKIEFYHILLHFTVMRLNFELDSLEEKFVVQHLFRVLNNENCFEGNSVIHNLPHYSIIVHQNKQLHITQKLIAYLKHGKINARD